MATGIEERRSFETAFTRCGDSTEDELMINQTDVVKHIASEPGNAVGDDRVAINFLKVLRSAVLELVAGITEVLPFRDLVCGKKRNSECAAFLENRPRVMFLRQGGHHDRFFKRNLRDPMRGVCPGDAVMSGGDNLHTFDHLSETSLDCGIDHGLSVPLQSSEASVAPQPL